MRRFTLPPFAEATCLIAAAAAACPIAAAPASAQAAPQQETRPAAADTAHTDTLDLPAIVVTATRVPLDREAIPTPVTVLTGDELRSRGVGSVAEALATVPGAAVVRSGGTGAQTSLFLRGGESDYVLVLVDGVPVNEPGGAFDFADLSTDQVERIEVVRGPVSVLYGSDAVSGVVQIFTRRGSGPPAVTATVTGGTGEESHEGGRYGTYDVDATVSGESADVSYSVGGALEHSGGQYPLNNARTLTTGSVRLGWTPAAGAEITLTSRLSDGRSHFPTDGAGNLVDENAYLDRRLWTTSLEGGWNLSERIDARLRLGLVTRDQASIDEPDGPSDTEGTFASTLRSDGVRRLADASINARILRSTITAGIAWESADGETAYTSESSFGPYDAAASFDRSTTGTYLQLLSEPVDGVHVTAGGRLDDSETYGTFATYRVGAALRVLPGVRVRGALGRGFREPTFAESFGSGFGDLGNPALDPERSRSWEVGIESELGMGGPGQSAAVSAAVGATVAATWFDQRFDDLIQYTFSSPTDGGPNYFNVGAARARGLELEGQLRRGGWSATASYAWLDTEVLDPGLATDATFAEGQRLLRRPEHSGSVAARRAWDDGAVGVTVNVVGEREDVDFGAAFPYPRVVLPAYATVDVAGEHALSFGGAPAVRLLLRVENALGADYQGAVGFPGPGRVFRAGIRIGTP